VLHNNVKENISVLHNGDRAMLYCGVTAATIAFQSASRAGVMFTVVVHTRNSNVFAFAIRRKSGQSKSIATLSMVPLFTTWPECEDFGIGCRFPSRSASTLWHRRYSQPETENRRNATRTMSGVRFGACPSKNVIACGVSLRSLR
jgi:hypothetical protein